MIDEFENKFYSFEFYDDGFMVKLKPRKMLFSEIFCYCLLFIAPIMLIFVGSFAKTPSYSHVVIGIILLICATIGIPLAFRYQRKRQLSFRFIINGEGVTHIELNNNYHFSWQDIVSYGIVNHNVISGRAFLNSNRQPCIYFSKKIYPKWILKWKCLRIPERSRGYASNKNIIIFAFLENEIDDFIRTKIFPYIYMYCDMEKEHSYISK